MSVSDLVSGLSQFFNSFAFSLFDIFALFISFVLNLILLPINLLLSAFFPDFSDLIVKFSNFVVYFSSMPLNYFIGLIPPLTRSMLALWLVIAIGYYTFMYSYRAIIVVPTLIRKIKFW